MENESQFLKIHKVAHGIFRPKNFIFIVVLFTTSVSLGKGRGQHAVIKLQLQLQVRVMVTPNGPIRAKQVN